MTSKTSYLIPFLAFALITLGCAKDNGEPGNILAYSVLVEVSGFGADLREKATLINNGQEILEISDDGEHHFEEQLKTGDAYDVVIYEEPKLANCNLENAQGIVGDDSPRINLICSSKTWHHPVDLTDKISPTGYDAERPSVDMDDDGNTIIAWEQHDGGMYNRIYKSEYRNGTWTHPGGNFDSINPDSSSAYYPIAKISSNGDAVIAWNQERYGEGGSEVFISEYRDNNWTHAASTSHYVSPGDGNVMPESVKLDMDDNGNTIIVYNYSALSENSQVFKSEYRDGTWTHPADLTDYISDSPVSSTWPEVAMADNGNAIIVWGDWTESPDKPIMMKEYTQGSWSENSSLVNIPYGSSLEWNVDMNDFGNAIITWRQDTGLQHIYKSEKINGTWFPPNNTDNFISPDMGFSYLPKAAISNNGDALISWLQTTPSRYAIFKSEKRNNSWIHSEDETDFIDPGFTSVDRSNIAMDGNGNSIITWIQNDGSVYGISGVYISEYRNGTWNHPDDLTDRISVRESNSEGVPVVAMSDNGDAVVVWTQDNGENTHIYMSEFR